MKTLLQTIIICMLCILLSVNTKAQTAVPVKDSMALVDFYNSTNGPSWTHHDNWLTGPIETWYGIELQIGFGWIKRILLSNNNLNGTIPKSFGDAFLNVAEIDVSHNNLSGVLPYINALHRISMSTLKFNNNHFTGSMPDVYAQFTYIDTLNLSYNNLSGGLPNYFSYTYIIDLNLSHNDFYGSIGNSWDGGYTQLKYFRINNNRVTGPIAFAAGLLDSLQVFDCSNNQMSGSIPPSFSTLYALKKFIASNNQFSGNVSFFTLLSLDTLDLSYNQFNFDGMEQVFQQMGRKAVYNDQAKIDIKRYDGGTALRVTAGGTLANNTYVWFRKGSADTTVIMGDSLFYPAQSGIYYVKVQNAVAKRLVLKSTRISYTIPLAANAGTTASNLNKNITNGKKNIAIYPNPVSNILYIQNSGNATIALKNQDGKTILLKKINGNTEINVSAYAAGVYYLHIVETGTTQNIVITH